MYKIIKLNSIDNEIEYEHVIHQIQAIFYAASSLKEFSSPERKQAFFKRWCGDYITNYPEQFIVMFESNKVLGYISGCSDSVSAVKTLEVPGYDLFQDLFSTFPAHFHINFHQDCRGLGLGSVLVNFYFKDLQKIGINGVHIVTSPDATNIGFYQRLGFIHEVIRNFNQKGLQFMGRLPG